MAGIHFFVYIGLSLEFVFGGDGISINKSIEHYAASNQAITTDEEHQNISELTQDILTDQEYPNISKLPQERPEKLKKPYFTPKALGIAVSVLGLSVLGYSLYYRKNQNKQDATLLESETSEETNELDYNPEMEETQETTLDTVDTLGEINEVHNNREDQQELGILHQQPKNQSIPNNFYLKLDDQPVLWQVGTKDSEMKYAYPGFVTDGLKPKELDSSIWGRQGGGIYSPVVYEENRWLLASASCLGLPRYRSRIGDIDKLNYPIYYLFFLESSERYLEKFKEIYEPRLNRVESKNIDNMIDDLFKDQEKAAVGKITTNLPVGFVVKAIFRNLSCGDETALYMCSHDFDANSGETTVSLAYRYTNQQTNIQDPLNAVDLIPIYILKPVLRTIACIGLNTLPEKNDKDDQTREIGTSAIGLPLTDTSTLPIGNDHVDGS